MGKEELGELDAHAPVSSLRPDSRIRGPSSATRTCNRGFRSRPSFPADFGNPPRLPAELSLPPTPSFRSGEQPVLIGMLGGIASGKSLAGRLLAGERGTVIDADRLAHEVLASEETVRFLRERFGPEVLDAEGRPSREALAKRVFSNPDDLKALEAWTHPLVRARILGELDAARDSHRNPIVLDVPLLLENDAQHALARKCDYLVFVDSDEADREHRARANRNWKPGERERREAAQWSMNRKRDAASHVISNRHDTNQLEQAIRGLRVELGLDQAN